MLNRTFIGKVSQYIDDNALLQHSGKYVVALSGGADSVCLALALKQLGYTVEAAHCNFNLRGAESLRDEDFCKRFCETNHIPLHVARFGSSFTICVIHPCQTATIIHIIGFAFIKPLCHFKGLVETAVGDQPGVVERKPAPDTVLAAMRELGGTPERSVYVGDSEVDIQTAKNAGIHCISVDWGFRTHEQLVGFGAEEIVSGAAELLKSLS